MFLLVPAHPGSPGQKAVKPLCVCMCIIRLLYYVLQEIHECVKDKGRSTAAVQRTVSAAPHVRKPARFRPALRRH